MKKHILGLLLVGILAISCFADLKAANSWFISTSNLTIRLDKTATLVTSSVRHGFRGKQATLVGASVAASSNAMFIAIGQGSSTTSSYTARYDVVIPMDRISPESAGTTESFVLGYNNDWWTQDIANWYTATDSYVNVQFRSFANGTVNAVDQAYLKFRLDTVSK